MLRNVVETFGRTGSSSATASVAKSLESAARILKTPEHFDASDTMSWVTWRHSFLNWLSYADSRFLDNIMQVEKVVAFRFGRNSGLGRSRVGPSKEAICGVNQLSQGNSLAAFQVRFRGKKRVCIVEDPHGPLRTCNPSKSSSFESGHSVVPSVQTCSWENATRAHHGHGSFGATVRLIAFQTF